MKTRLLFLTFCFCTFSLYSQITLEHSFTNIGDDTRPFFTHNATMFYNSNKQTRAINIYNSDYSLYKTIYVPQLSGYDFYGAFSFSTKLYNLDDLIEFCVWYRKPDAHVKLILYSENMNQIMDFGDVTSYELFTTTDNKAKLMVYSYTTDITDIYSLPGTIPNPNSVDENYIIQDQKSNLPFPNPASSFVILPYSLKQNESSTMRIFNSAGQLIEKFQIIGSSNGLNLSIEKYTAGIYIYEYNGLTNTFIVN